jgi:hypothetical protein
MAEESENLPGKGESPRLLLLAHVVPFAAWMLLMLALQHVGPEGAWRYALRTGICAALFIGLRPWRWYRMPKLKNVPAALLVGILVYVAWVFPEVRWTEEMPFLQELYQRFGILPLGRLPEVELPNMYDPRVCGWPLTLTRLAGSALVIAVIEEFFWRGFLYRWLIDRTFWKTGLGTFDWEAFAIMCLLFGLEHNRWLAGIVAGAAYGLLMIRTRDVWAASLAHVVTNLILGIHVIVFNKWVFW